jgi:O-antigen biosynthesis protein
MRSVSVVIPVKDGERHLERLLSAVRAEGDLEVLVIDSGSRDRSHEIVRAAGAELVEIRPEEFGHGRTRNLGAEGTSGDLICFLTQDAVPAEGWLAAYREAFELDERVGAAYGPHLPWPDTSPMIARELTEFFAGMAPDGRPALQRRGELAFLSNVNACYARDCWAELRFPDLDYAEDQAFGAAMLEAGWVKVFHPGAGVFHAHDYGPVEFARRYFDEGRGLRETVGHVEPLRPDRVARGVSRGVAGDVRWMREQGWPAGRRWAWTGRSLIHHAGRAAGSGLGTRANRLPAAVERRLSLERRASGGANDGAGTAPTDGAVAPSGGPRFADVLTVAREGPAPLAELAPGAADRERLHLAFVVPPFRRGSGGHNTIFQLVWRLERMGHLCSIWIHDATGLSPPQRAAVVRNDLREWFAPVEAPVFADLDHWHGADVAVATGWDTAHPVAALPGCGARAYLVNDHEPEFFGTSAERLWAAQTYELGLYPISASRWLRDLLAERHGCEGGWFRLGVDHTTYRPGLVPRRDDTVIFYARAATPRRAVPLGVLALEELVRRRPGTRVAMFGQQDAVRAGFPYAQLGIASPEQLARHYCEATVGVCLSLTNYSLIPQEMMACGLPCVDVGGGSSEAVFGADGPVELAASDPIALADATERLLADRELWRSRSEAGLAFVADASWDTAAEQVERGLRDALARELAGTHG